jgi:hypothetical protein
MRLAVLLAGHVALAACYSPDLQDGVACSQSGRCPEGQTCVMPDNLCLRVTSDGGGSNDGGCAPGQRQVVGVGRLQAGDAEAGDQLGGAIAMSSQWLAIGADLDDDLGEDAGAVYMFERDGAAWVERQKLTASDGDTLDRFGIAVALDGDHLVVGASNAGTMSAGAAYVFELAATWEERTILAAAGGMMDDLFGRAVAIVDGRIAVGAPGTSAGTGEVHMYAGSGATWDPDGDFLPGDAAESFGGALAMSTTRLAIGTKLDDDGGTGSGSVFLLVLDAGAWVSGGKVVASDAAANDQFGSSVALTEGRLIVGAPFRGDTGAVYVYQDAAEANEQVITASSPSANDAFGSAVSSSGDLIAIGAPSDDEEGTSSGTVTVVGRDGSTWTEVELFGDDDPAEFDTFGAALALDGLQLVVGSPLRDGDPTPANAGSASAFDLPCP